MLTQRLEAGLQEPPATVGDDPDVEPVVFVHAAGPAPSAGTQSWIETQRRIGNSS